MRGDARQNSLGAISDRQNVFLCGVRLQLDGAREPVVVEGIDELRKRIVAILQEAVGRSSAVRRVIAPALCCPKNVELAAVGLVTGLIAELENQLRNFLVRREFVEWLAVRSFVGMLFILRDHPTEYFREARSPRCVGAAGKQFCESLAALEHCPSCELGIAGRVKCPPKFQLLDLRFN